MCIGPEPGSVPSLAPVPVREGRSEREGRTSGAAQLAHSSPDWGHICLRAGCQPPQLSDLGRKPGSLESGGGPGFPTVAHESSKNMVLGKTGSQAAPGPGREEKGRRRGWKLKV